MKIVIGKLAYFDLGIVQTNLIRYIAFGSLTSVYSLCYLQISCSDNIVLFQGLFSVFFKPYLRFSRNER